jgi:anti-anti-sigma regulatory factor
MPTQITQTDDQESGRSVLRVEGDMLLEDAVVLERIATDISSETGRRVAIDLADLDFLDSESAPILKRISRQQGIEIQGMEIFLQSAVDTAERAGR